MELANHLYQDRAQLDAFIEQHRLGQRRGLLQIFTGVTEHDRLRPLLAQLSRQLPGFAMVGASTSGEVCGPTITDGRILLSFSTFDHTRIDTLYIDDLSFANGNAIGRELAGSDARLVLGFGNTLRENPERFLHGLSQGAPDVCIAGGNAGDNARFRDTFVILNGEIHDRGLVLAVLRGEQLQVHNRQVLNWTPIGIEMRVTRNDGNIIYELNDTPILDLYRYYLGSEVADKVPESLMEFPLLGESGGQPVARSPVGATADGGLIYAGEFIEGQSVRFGVADIDTILTSAADTAADLARTTPIEAMYIYSCTARRAFLKSNIASEIASLAAAGPCAGFFTYGEYFHMPGDNRLLNITTTLVALSEQDRIRDDQPQPQPAIPPHASTLRSLTHLSNVTARELRQSLELFEQYKHALDQTAIVSKTDKAGRITYVNALFEEISGYRADEVIGKTHRILRHPDMPASLFDEMWKTISNKQIWTGTIKNRKKDGGYYYVHSTILPILDAQGEITEYIGIRDDITSILLNEERIAAQLTDKLTGLPSRTRLLEDIEREQSTVLALADVASFKLINDYYGIATGDRLIADLAERLRQQLLASGIRVYRLYGAVFGFLPPAGMDKATLEQHLLAADRALNRQPLQLDDEVIDAELYFGMAEGRQHLMALAETALQKAKQQKIHDSVLTYSEQDERHLNSLFWIREVKAALAEGRIISHYQLIAPAHGSAVCKYESLLRLVDRNGRIVSPYHFLDIIKHTKYYPSITRQVVRRAIVTAAKTGCHISINLSAEDIDNRETRDFILGELRQHGGSNLIFEITEGESLKDYEEVKAFIRSIRAYDAAIAIDDFGSGYSNFSYLVELQPEFIKIDGSIISGILTDKNSLLVTESIIDLAHKIGARVIAEFVSSDEIADTLRALGVDYLQGFAVGKPGPFA